MTRETCILTTKDFTILEVMRDRFLGRRDPFTCILNRKLETATVMFRDDIPVNVATLSSRVTFSVDGRHSDTRIISHDGTTAPVGLFLPITTARGLALLGLREGQEFVIRAGEGEQERIVLHEVLYQPEAARREKRTSCATAGKPRLRVVQGALHQPHCPVRPNGFDDPGPSAA